MKKQGAIILGIGGDNSKGSAGTFYEGVMTTGYASAATETAVQANIVAAGYQRRRHGGGATGPIMSGVNSAKCVDNNGRQRRQRQQDPDLGLRRRRHPQNWTVDVQRHHQVYGKLPGHHRRQLQQRHPRRVVDLQRRRQPAMEGQQRRARQPNLRQVPRRPQRQHHQRHPAPDMDLQRRHQPEMDNPVSSGDPPPEQPGRHCQGGGRAFRVSPV